MIRRRVKLDDVQRQIIARLALQPCTVHGHGNVAIVVQCPGRRPGDCSTPGGVHVVQFNGDGGIDGVIVGIPCYYANER